MTPISNDPAPKPDTQPVETGLVLDSPIARRILRRNRDAPGLISTSALTTRLFERVKVGVNRSPLVSELQRRWTPNREASAYYAVPTLGEPPPMLPAVASAQPVSSPDSIDAIPLQRLPAVMTAPQVKTTPDASRVSPVSAPGLAEVPVPARETGGLPRYPGIGTASDAALGPGSVPKPLATPAQETGMVSLQRQPAEPALPADMNPDRPLLAHVRRSASGPPMPATRVMLAPAAAPEPLPGQGQVPPTRPGPVDSVVVSPPIERGPVLGETSIASFTSLQGEPVHAREFDELPLQRQVADFTSPIVQAASPEAFELISRETWSAAEPVPMPLVRTRQDVTGDSRGQLVSRAPTPAGTTIARAEGAVLPTPSAPPEPALTGSAGPAVNPADEPDEDELVERVLSKFMRRVAVEGERRGQLS